MSTNSTNHVRRMSWLLPLAVLWFFLPLRSTASRVGNLLKKLLPAPNLGIEELPRLFDEQEFEIRYYQPVPQEVFCVVLQSEFAEIVYNSSWEHGRGRIEDVRVSHKGKTGMSFTYEDGTLAGFQRSLSVQSHLRELWPSDMQALSAFMRELHSRLGVVHHDA